jgi:hypothetical protein
MKCREFERACNELIDAGLPITGRGAAAGSHADGRGPAAHTREPKRAANDRDRLLLDHAARCPACRAVAARYEILQRALATWGPPPAAPAGLADRILAAAEAHQPSVPPSRGGRRTERFWRARLPLATVAATIVAAVTVGVLMPRLTVARSRLKQRAPRGALTPVRGGAVGSDPASSGVLTIDEALAGATAATWDLARSASEPAARISRQVLGAATEPQVNRSLARPGDDDLVLLPSLDSLAPGSNAAVAMLQQVGDRLSTRVSPLSNTARHAFGFLLQPTPAKTDVRTNPPAAKGA